MEYVEASPFPSAYRFNPSRQNHYLPAMKSHVARTVLLIALGTVLTAPALASGSYSGRAPKPPANSTAATKMDREKYGLGQRVYDSGIMTANGGNAEAQSPRLKAAQMKLPPEAAKSKNLPALAGKLSAAQLEALEYFVEQRFGMKK